MTQTPDGKKPLDRSKPVSASGPRPAETAKLAEALDGGDLPNQSNIEKIRSILFGNQMRDYEARFHRLEERISSELSELREDFRRRNEALEGYVRQELDALGERLTSEYTDRSSSLQSVEKSVEELGKSLDKRAHHLDEQMNKAHRELRQQVLGQSKQLRDEMQLGLDEISTLLARELKQVRTDKTDRTALAALLTDLAARLSADA